MLLEDGRVQFSHNDPNAHTVSLAGGFNRWHPEANPMKKSPDGTWTLAIEFEPGMHQYKFVVDGNWIQDPQNPAGIDDNHGGLNSVFVLTDDGRILLESQSQGPVNPDDIYPDGPSVHLAIIWHQHQPLYADPVEDYLRGPWVRLHATKDYYDMAAILEDYPEIHVTINLTSVLIRQLQQYYVDRLALVVEGNRVNEELFFSNFADRTDPWIDLLLKNTEDFGSSDDEYLYGGHWNCFGISEVMIERFPEYKALRDKGSNFTTNEKLQLKVWFAVAWFDPDFLDGPVKLVTGETVDLSDLVERRGDKWFARRPFSEDDANRIVAESYKVMAAVVPIHRKLMDDARAEIITTPYFHPILPLVHDSDVAKICQPGTPLPERYSYPKDAELQVKMGAAYFGEVFGRPPIGMWPAEGGVSHDVVSIFSNAGIDWIATADGVLQKSTPPNQPIYRPYRVESEEAHRPLAVFFRDTELSDRIGFVYQTKTGEEAAEDFVQKVLTYAKEGEDRLVTVILDGENAWEWYRFSPDAKDFLHAFYRKLTKLQRMGRIITVTPGEYILGNPDREIEARETAYLTRLESLWPGSWINANFDTWIGEHEENGAWNMLGRVRRDVESWGIAPPRMTERTPANAKRKAEIAMWEALLAAEGSDWFWWFGDDQNAPGGDEPFDEAFRTHLANVYRYAQMAGVETEIPEFPPVLIGSSAIGGGTMARGVERRIPVTFVVDASHVNVPEAIYIVGSPPELGSWTPNKIPMRQDATRDKGMWSITVELPAGAYIEYKYTNSGKEGQWIPGEEFPMTNRAATVTSTESAMTIIDKFGEI